MADPDDGRLHAHTHVPIDPSDATLATFASAAADDDHDTTDDINHLRGQGVRWNDRGNFYYETMRKKCHLPSLVATGRHAGRSMVRMHGRSLLSLITFDMFTTLVEMPWRYLSLFVSSLYLSSFLFFALVWYGISRIHGSSCLLGIGKDGFNASFIFSVATQMTIGYGTRSIKGDCRIATLVLIIQSLIGIFIDALSLGLIFARVTHPKHRTRSVFISDAACIACRDGALTFMFRVGDVRDRKVISPKVRACLYTWHGRQTSEGEFLPVRAQNMEINYRDDLMLLPITIEHVINEKSPLYGHTHESLLACGAEVVVSFEGCIDTTGLRFSARQSYLPNEILWGHTFVRIVSKAGPGEIHHQVNLRQFHELEPQRMLSLDPCVARCGVQCGGRALLTAQQMSEATIEAAREGGRGIVPFPAIGTNTLVVSDCIALSLASTASNILSSPPSSISSEAPLSDPITVMPTQLKLAFRVGDSRSPWGSQFTGVTVRAYLHMWVWGRGNRAEQPAREYTGSRQTRSSGDRDVEHKSYDLKLNPCGSGEGDKYGCELSLWAPVTVEHTVDERSPLRKALIQRGNDPKREFADGWETGGNVQLQLAPNAQILVEVVGTCLTGFPCMRRRCYRARDVRVGHVFAPVVMPPSRRPLWSEPEVDFERFHITIPYFPADSIVIPVDG